MNMGELCWLEERKDPTAITASLALGLLSAPWPGQQGKDIYTFSVTAETHTIHRASPQNSRSL